MSEVIGSQFKRNGILNRRERLTLFLGTPFIATFLFFEVIRFWRAFQGEPLFITGLTEPDVAVTWSDGPLLFVLGLVLHLAIVLALVAGLVFQLEQGRRWLRSKRH